jgi:hypothetical protein
VKKSYLILGAVAIVAIYLYTKNTGTANQTTGNVSTNPGATTPQQGLANNIGNGAYNILTAGINGVQNLVSSGIGNITSGLNNPTETNYTPQQAAGTSGTTQATS